MNWTLVFLLAVSGLTFVIVLGLAWLIAPALTARPPVRNPPPPKECSPK